jgi:hypothetical protein
MRTSAAANTAAARFTLASARPLSSQRRQVELHQAVLERCKVDTDFLGQQSDIGFPQIGQMAGAEEVLQNADASDHRQFLGDGIAPRLQLIEQNKIGPGFLGQLYGAQFPGPKARFHYREL